MARHLLSQANVAGVNTLVLDPSRQTWDADYQTADADEFVRVVFDNTQCLVIIDETREALGKNFSRETAHRLTLATRSRHRGHTVFFIAQRPTFVNADIRGQCSQAFIFRPHYKYDRHIYQEMFGDDVDQIYSITPGSCLHFKPGAEAQTVKIL
ncbi:MAG: zonular occludens toxin domain-containing protein [Pseudomonadota bacterium]